MAGKNKNIGKTFNGDRAMFHDPIEHVKTAFEGLSGVVEKLPDGKEKTTITGWVADAYLAASKTIFNLMKSGAPVQA